MGGAGGRGKHDQNLLYEKRILIKKVRKMK